MKIGILTSGGDSPGMNAAVRAATRTALSKGIEVYGIERGYNGLIDGDIKQLKTESVADILHRGGTILQTARSERFRTEAGQKRAMDMLSTFGIDGLVVVGGDGSMRGAVELTKLGARVMCLPGTIDNDMGYTDFTIGFDTAVNTVLGAISNIRDTSSSHDRTTIIEVMGRHCGDIALYAGFAGGAETVLVPEKPFNMSDICRKIIQGKNRGKKHNIIIKAEGIEIDSYEMAKQIEERTGVEAKVVILSYLQRGGSPSAYDRILASTTAVRAVELLEAGSGSRAIGINGGEITDYDIEEALKMTKPFKEKYLEIVEILS